jgi:predicted acylesterase/phospholipase RssA
MGCAIAMIAAMDHPDQAAFADAVTDAIRDPLDYTLPSVAMVKGRRIAAAVERLVGDRTVEDLPIPALGVSTDLTGSAVAVHRRGDLRRVIRASVAIPGVIPPVVIDGSLHVDAGVLNNLPIEVVRREVRSGTVIAVDVAPPRGPRVREDFGIAVSGWRQLFDRLVPGRRPIQAPTLSATTMRAMLATAVRERERALDAGLCDLYLHLGRLPCSLLDFHATDRVAEAGYEAAREPVAMFAHDHPTLRPTVRPPDSEMVAASATSGEGPP